MKSSLPSMFVSLPASLAGALAAMLPLFAPADIVPTDGVWHFTGYVFEGAAYPPSSEAEVATGTATLAHLSGTTYRISFDVEGGEESFDLTLHGNMLVGASVEDAGGGLEEHWRMTLRIVDDETILLSDFWATFTEGELLPLSYDCAGGVLTRNPLPAPDPGAWAGDHSLLGSLDLSLESGEGIHQESEEDIEGVTLVADGGSTYILRVDDEDELVFEVSGDVLKFEEVDATPFVFFENSAWLQTSLRSFDYAYALQLENGRIVVIGSGGEIVRLESKNSSYEQDYVAWADLYVALGGSSATDPPDGRYAAWVSALGLEGAMAEADAQPFPDGLPNLVRYAMNFGASPASDELPAYQQVDDEGELFLEVVFRMRKEMADVELALQTSVALDATWTPVAAGLIEQLPDADPQTARYRARLPLEAGGRRFIRLAALPVN